jgi:predicted nuclease of predicted toxin-antitoxin system
MSISRKLASVLALALAAMAVTVAPAFATTVSPTGNYSGTETSAGTLTSNNGTVITCQSSDFAATILADGTVTVTSLTFGNCTEPNLGLSCTVTVTTLPANLQINFASPRSTWQAAAVSEAATITCALGTVVCEASVDGTLTGSTSNSSPGTFVVSGTNNVTIDAGSVACGTVATWSQSWDITSPASYSITA